MNKSQQGKKNREAGQRFELKENKYSLANKKRWSNPDYKKRVSKSISKSMKGKKTRLGAKLSEESKKKIKNSNYHKNLKGKNKGDKNHYWKGDDAQYGSIHGWINKNFVLLHKCEICNSQKKKLEWSNKDHNYKRNKEDWQAICRYCHRKYDKENNR